MECKRIVNFWNWLKCVSLWLNDLNHKRKVEKHRGAILTCNRKKSRERKTCRWLIGVLYFYGHQMCWGFHRIKIMLISEGSETLSEPNFCWRVQKYWFEIYFLLHSSPCIFVCVYMCFCVCIYICMWGFFCSFWSSLQLLCHGWDSFVPWNNRCFLFVHLSRVQYQ